MISESNKKRLRAIQYNALRISFRKPIKTKNEELLQLWHATKLDDRIEHLKKNILKTDFKIFYFKAIKQTG